MLNLTEKQTKLLTVIVDLWPYCLTAIDIGEMAGAPTGKESEWASSTLRQLREKGLVERVRMSSGWRGWRYHANKDRCEEAGYEVRNNARNMTASTESEALALQRKKPWLAVYHSPDIGYTVASDEAISHLVMDKIIPPQVESEEEARARQVWKQDSLF